VQLQGRSVDVVITSPLSRAVQTTILVFGNRSTSIVIDERINEHKYVLCDLGSDKNVMQAQFPNVNFASLSSNYNMKETKEAYLQRVKTFSDIRKLIYNVSRPFPTY
jgi:broad specificity phosphatase PhoE